MLNLAFVSNLEYFRVADVIRRLLLDKVEQRLGGADVDDERAAVLVAVALHVAAQAKFTSLKIFRRAKLKPCW